MPGSLPNIEPAPAPLPAMYTRCPKCGGAEFPANAGCSCDYNALKDLQDRCRELEAELAKTRNSLACATCIFRSTKDDPCPHLAVCCYSTGKGHADGKNCWESDTPLELLA